DFTRFCAPWVLYVPPIGNGPNDTSSPWVPSLISSRSSCDHSALILMSRATIIDVGIIGRRPGLLVLEPLDSACGGRPGIDQPARLNSDGSSQRRRISTRMNLNDTVSFCVAWLTASRDQSCWPLVANRPLTT